MALVQECVEITKVFMHPSLNIEGRICDGILPVTLLHGHTYGAVKVPKWRNFFNNSNHDTVHDCLYLSVRLDNSS